MSHPVDTDLERLTPILARLVERLNPEAIWLFGSRAEGRARPDSDYDLLVVVPDGAPGAELDAVGAMALKVTAETNQLIMYTNAGFVAHWPGEYTLPLPSVGRHM